jgi:protein SCO1
MTGKWKRRSTARTLAALAAMLLLAGCQSRWTLDHQDFSAKSLPPLNFTLTDSDTGKPATAADFRGKIVMLYFGYTNCPDVCPLTLTDATRMFHMIGAQAKDIRFLFVTVDPQRDTLPVLRHYVALFDAKNIIGLRGSPAELSAVAARYHASYTVHPSSDPAKFAVTHTAAIDVFNRAGKPQFIISGLATKHPDLDGIARDLRHLLTAGKA